MKKHLFFNRLNVEKQSIAGPLHAGPFWVANFDLKSLVLPRVSPCLLFLLVLQIIAGSHWCFQFLASILNGFFKFLVLRVNEPFMCSA